MDRFVSHYALRLDAKGRVSIRAPFRAGLGRDGFDGLYCYPTSTGRRWTPVVRCSGRDVDRALFTYSEEQEQLSAALYGTSRC